jgi:hypothetical protein
VEPSTSEAVEELLRQLVDARFVLTDRDGAVTRWSDQAEGLFGWPGQSMLGQPLAETLALDVELPVHGGRLETEARRKDGHKLQVELVLVPVLMSQSLEFNGFLEALEISAPRGNALEQLGRSHRAVLDWIGSAIAGHAEVDDGSMAAGTIVAFRSLTDPPPLADTLERAESVERLLEGTAADLEEARLEVERARGEAAKATAKIDVLALAEDRLEAELSETRRILEETRTHVVHLRSEIDQSRTDSQEQGREERERLHREASENAAEATRLRRDVDRMRQTVWSS